MESDMKDNDIKVTVYCLTYNHEVYIQDALDGFVNQKTNFKYQVIVHDDASTDNTATIIKEYYTKYSDIIVPILQEDNKYSKRIGIVSSYIAPLVKGKYIAVCEGDDYWCDEYKLQKQFDVMESDDSLSACAHNTWFLDVASGKKIKQYPCNGNYVLAAYDVLKRGGSGFHTSSLFYRRRYLEVPQQYQIPSVGDYSRAIYLTTVGKIYYISDVMSVYRKNVPGSWSSRQSNKTMFIITQKSIEVLNYADKEMGYIHHSDIEKIIRTKEFYSLLYQNKYKDMIREYKDVLGTEFSKNNRIKLYIKAYAPLLYSLYRIIRATLDKSYNG